VGFAKMVVAAAWVLAIVSLLTPSTSNLLWTGRALFWFLLVAHAVECLIFLPALRRAGGSLAEHLAKTMVFGVFYVRGLPG